MRRIRRSGVVGLLGVIQPSSGQMMNLSLSIDGGDPFIALGAPTSCLAAWERSGRPSKSRHAQQ